MPQFDNMYLDMNGIVHNCSHPDDSNVHFRITEEQIFRDIFHYLDTLFRLIQPTSLFFMAIDGVAPRAKMNQQRGRRYVWPIIQRRRLWSMNDDDGRSLFGLQLPFGQRGSRLDWQGQREGWNFAGRISIR